MAVPSWTYWLLVAVPSPSGAAMSLVRPVISIPHEAIGRTGRALRMRPTTAMAARRSRTRVGRPAASSSAGTR